MSIYGHGPTTREQAILDLHEAGCGLDAIGAELGLSRSYVQQVVWSLAAPPLVNWQGPAARGSAMLLAAIRRHHPDRCDLPA